MPIQQVQDAREAAAGEDRVVDAQHVGAGLFPLRDFQHAVAGIDAAGGKIAGGEDGFLVDDRAGGLEVQELR